VELFSDFLRTATHQFGTKVWDYDFPSHFSSDQINAALSNIRNFFLKQDLNSSVYSMTIKKSKQ